MNKIQSFKVFLGDVVAEIKKTTWPARDELMQSTIVVIVSLLILGVFVALSDKIIGAFVGYITKT